MANNLMTGEEALAQGAIDEHIILATGYPGSPAGGIISILDSDTNAINVHWSANEKIAVEKGIGVAMNGKKALICVKGVGLNAMLDPLTVVNLTPLPGALVIVVGDDPGGYGSQNDQDSRLLAQFLNLPWFEPADADAGYTLIRLAFRLSAKYGMPVFIRITRSYAMQQQEINRTVSTTAIPAFDLTKIIEPRFVPVPKNAVAKHQELISRMNAVKNLLPSLKINKILASKSKTGLIVCGHLINKLTKVCDLKELQKFSGILFLQSIYPISDAEIIPFLSGLKKVLIIEENTPVITTQVLAMAAGNKVNLNWQSLHHPGEIFRWQIAQFLKEELPGLTIRQEFNRPVDEKPKLAGKCGESHYDEVLDLIDASARHIGKNVRYYGDPGCLVNVSNRLQAKFAMGGSVATAFGANRADSGYLNLALVGDSGFFHSSLPAIIDAAYHQANIPIVLLNNRSALTTGGQYHPGINQEDASQRLDYQAILKSCGLHRYYYINFTQNRKEADKTLIAFLKLKGVRFLQIDIDS